MGITMQEFEFESDHGSLSATLNMPVDADCCLLLAHGAGADHRHRHMQALAISFGDVGIATLRFNFPFKQQGRHRVDSKSVSTDCIVRATEVLREQTDLPLFIGGHSFGGRMATHAAAEGLIECTGLVLCSFPLHPAGKPGIARAKHLKEIDKPMLFLSGTRDGLAQKDLLTEVCSMPGTTLHWLETADHSFSILKRKRDPLVDVYDEAAQAAGRFVAGIIK